MVDKPKSICKSCNRLMTIASKHMQMCSSCYHRITVFGDESERGESRKKLSSDRARRLKELIRQGLRTSVIESRLGVARTTIKTYRLTVAKEDDNAKANYNRVE